MKLSNLTQLALVASLVLPVAAVKAEEGTTSPAAQQLKDEIKKDKVELKEKREEIRKDRKEAHEKRKEIHQKRLELKKQIKEENATKK